ncbi:MAG: hypothetical protein EB127_21790, partial [Alphaproteobacteria bacterium]|nr:hypothetical protein [Alphaproteobacteria bacterium]
MSVASDVSLNSRLFVSSDVSLNGDVRLGKSMVVIGDASLNSHLSVASDVSLNSRLFVSSDVSLNGDVRLGKSMVVIGDASLNSHLSVASDVSLNSRLFVSSDVSLNGRLSVKNDVSMNSKLQVLGSIYQGTELVATQPYVTNALIPYALLSGAEFTGPITVDTVGGIKTSSNGNLNLAPNGSGIVHIKGDLKVDGSVNFMGEFIQTNTNVTVTEQLNIANDGTGPALIVSQVGANDVATFIQGSETVMVIKDGGFIGINKTNPTKTLDVSGSLYIEGKSTFNDITYFIKDVSMSANVNAPTPSTSENSTKVATTAYVKQQGYATITGTETLTNKTINATGLITAQSGLLVSNDSTFNGRIYVSTDSSFNGITNLNTAVIGASNDTHKLTINSGKINVYDGISTFYDVSTSKLVYIKDLSENVQTRLTDLINRTLAINTNGSDANTKIQVDTINNQILISSNIIPTNNSINLGSADHPFNSIYVNTKTLHFTDTNVSAAISYNSNTGSLDLTTNGITSTQVNSYNGNVGIGKISSDAVATLDVSGTTIISGLTVIKSDLSLNTRLSVAGDVSFNGNLTVSKNVGVGLSTPLAPLHINGGMITTSDGFPRKLYSYNTGSVSLSSSSSAFVLTFSNTSTYFANITAMLVDQTSP